MPFTPSHAIVAVPLRRLGLPFAAVAAGAMTPDVAVFLPALVDYDATHSLRGILTVDAPLAVTLVVVWWAWLRAPVVDLAPAALRLRAVGRVDQPWGRRRWWALVVGAALVGSATHVVWDSFTHPGAWGPEHLSWLRTQVGPLRVTKWLQYASGVLGLAGLLAWWWAEIRSRPAAATGPRLRRGRSALRAVPAVAVALGVVVAVATRDADEGFHRLLVRAVASGGVGCAVGVVVVGAAWTALRRQQPGPDREGRISLSP